MEQPKIENKIEGKEEFASRLISEEQKLLKDLESGNFKAIEALILMSKLAKNRSKEY